VAFAKWQQTLQYRTGSNADTESAMENQELVDELLEGNLQFIQRTKDLAEYKELPVATVGTTQQEEIKLTIQHAIGEDGGIWKSEHVAEGVKNKNNQYAIEFARSGKYKISCHRCPMECSGAILGVPTENPKNQFRYKSISPEKIRIKLFNQEAEKEVLNDQEAVDFLLELPAGKTLLQTDFIEGAETYGVYYTYIKKIDGV
jgi:hypothetical protein